MTPQYGQGATLEIVEISGHVEILLNCLMRAGRQHLAGQHPDLAQQRGHDVAVTDHRFIVARLERHEPAGQMPIVHRVVPVEHAGAGLGQQLAQCTLALERPDLDRGAIILRNVIFRVAPQCVGGDTELLCQGAATLAVVPRGTDQQIIDPAAFRIGADRALAPQALRHRVTSPQKGQHGFGSPDALKIRSGGPFGLLGADIQFGHSSSDRPVSASSFMVRSVSRNAGAGQAN
jgi:hypothetical protein